MNQEATRAEHIQTCKTRAYTEYEFSGRIQDAFSSMCSDLNKHPETQGHVGIQLGTGLLMLGEMSTYDQLTSWIDGFS